MRIAFLFLLLIICIHSIGQDMKSGGRLKPEQANMDIRHYTLALNVDPTQQSIDGFTEIDLVLAKPSDVLLLDFTHMLAVRSIMVDGRNSNFTHDSSGMNLKPFFYFYLRTTNKFEVNVKQLAEDRYKISLLNFDMPLPMEITTAEATKKIIIDKKGVEVKSATLPEVDKKGYYYKRLILE